MEGWKASGDWHVGLGAGFSFARVLGLFFKGISGSRCNERHL